MTGSWATAGKRAGSQAMRAGARYSDDYREGVAASWRNDANLKDIRPAQLARLPAEVPLEARDRCWSRRRLDFLQARRSLSGPQCRVAARRRARRPASLAEQQGPCSADLIVVDQTRRRRFDGKAERIRSGRRAERGFAISHLGMIGQVSSAKLRVIVSERSADSKTGSPRFTFIAAGSAAAQTRADPMMTASRSATLEPFGAKGRGSALGLRTDGERAALVARWPRPLDAGRPPAPSHLRPRARQAATRADGRSHHHNLGDDPGGRG